MSTVYLLTIVVKYFAWDSHRYLRYYLTGFRLSLILISIFNGDMDAYFIIFVFAYDYLFLNEKKFNYLRFGFDAKCSIISQSI